MVYFIPMAGKIICSPILNTPPPNNRDDHIRVSASGKVVNSELFWLDANLA